MSSLIRYDQTIEWLYNLHLFGIKFGLKKIEKLLDYLGNPQDSLRIIHVGGTNGKGSVCTMLSSMLNSAGYKVGLNTSPHLSSFTERIQINGQNISEAQVVEYANQLREIREKVNKDTEYGYATYFEVVTAMALKYFADNNVDYVVLEVGLGGTFDATNVVKPIITVLTNIDLDHTEHLGNTLTSVAENKAGIIKPNIPVISSNTNDEVLEVITNTSNELNCRLYCIGKDFDFDIISSDTTGISLNYQGFNSNYSNLKIPLLGTYQAENAAVAISALKLLSQLETEPEEPKISDETIRNGLEQSRWPGRLEVVQHKPIVLLDGAHNPAGAATLRNAIKLFEYDNLYIVFGCSEEKDIKSITSKLLPLANKIFITQADIRRAAEPKLILKNIEDYDLDKVVIKPVKAAVTAAIEQAQNTDLICICGSLFVVGEARELWFGIDDNNKSKKKLRIHY